jgi:hypothetical protein
MKPAWYACGLLTVVLAQCGESAPPTDADAAAVAAADSLAAVAPTAPVGPQPDVWLVPVVTDVLLRREPSTQAARAGRLGPSIRWTGEASAHRDTIALRGRAQAFPWYRVVQPDSTLAWVYGGTVRPGLFDFRPSAGLPPRSANAWIGLEKIDPARFEAAVRRAGPDSLRRIVPVEGAGPEVRIALRQGERTYRDVLSQGESHRDHTYVFEQGGFVVLQRRFYEWWDLLFVRRDDGTEYETFGGSHHVPLAAPGMLRWAWPSRQGHEGKVPFYEGVEIFDAVAVRSIAVQLGTVEQLAWESERGLLLARRTAQGGLDYYRLTIHGAFE